MSIPGFRAEASIYRTTSRYVSSAWFSDGGGEVLPQACDCPGITNEFVCDACAPATGAAFLSCLPLTLTSCADYKNCLVDFFTVAAPFCLSCATSMARQWCGGCTTCTNCHSEGGFCFCDDSFCGVASHRCCGDSSSGNTGGGGHTGGGRCCGGNQKCCGRCAFDLDLRRPTCDGDCVKMGEVCP
jgi:hypothetical protein